MPIISPVETTLRAALEAIGDGVLILDADGRVLLANEPWRKMWNIPPKHTNDQIHASLRDLSPPPVSEKSYDLLELERGRLVERLLTPLLHHGDSEGRVFVYRDVTDRIQADSELRDANRALDRIATGYRGVWHTVATVLRRLLVTQQTLGAYEDAASLNEWELLDAVQLISRHGGVERSRRDRVDLSGRSAEVAGYTARIGRSAGVSVSTTVGEDVQVATDVDLFVAGVVAAFLGFLIAVAPGRESIALGIDRENDGPVRLTISPGVPRSDLDRLHDYDPSRPGALHAALLGAFAATLGLELSVPEDSTDEETIIEVSGL